MGVFTAPISTPWNVANASPVDPLDSDLVLECPPRSEEEDDGCEMVTSHL